MNVWMFGDELNMKEIRFFLCWMTWMGMYVKFNRYRQFVTFILVEIGFEIINLFFNLVE
mgnify:CR=1 FL=1